MEALNIVPDAWSMIWKAIWVALFAKILPNMLINWITAAVGLIILMSFGVLTVFIIQIPNIVKRILKQRPSHVT